MDWMANPPADYDAKQVLEEFREASDKIRFPLAFARVRVGDKAFVALAEELVDVVNADGSGTTQIGTGHFRGFVENP